jgi:hypothetical protein
MKDLVLEQLFPPPHNERHLEDMCVYKTWHQQNGQMLVVSGTVSPYDKSLLKLFMYERDFKDGQ